MTRAPVFAFVAGVAVGAYAWERVMNTPAAPREQQTTHAQRVTQPQERHAARE